MQTMTRDGTMVLVLAIRLFETLRRANGNKTNRLYFFMCLLWSYNAAVGYRKLYSGYRSALKVDFTHGVMKRRSHQIDCVICEDPPQVDSPRIISSASFERGLILHSKGSGCLYKTK